MQEPLALDRDERPTSTGRRGQHEGRLLAGLERVLVHQDLDPTREVAQVARLLVGHECTGLGAHVAVTTVDAVPTHAVVAVSGRLERPLRRAVGTRRQGRLGHGLLLVVLGNENPTRCRQARVTPGPIQLRPRQLTPLRIAPALDPTLARDLDPTLDRHGIPARVLGREVDLDVRSRAMDGVTDLDLGEVLALRDAHAALALDFAPRGIGDARLDRVLEVVLGVDRSVEGHDHASFAVGLHHLVQNLLPVPVPPILVRRLVEPRELTLLGPGVRVGLLVDVDLDVGLAYRTAEVVAGLDLDGDLVSDHEEPRTSGILTVGSGLVGHAHRDLELRTLVLLQPEELSAAHVVAPLGQPVELDLVDTERHGGLGCEARRRGTEVAQRRLSLFHDRAEGVHDLPAELLLGRRGVGTAVAVARHELPLNLLPRAIGRSVGEGVDSILGGRCDRPSSLRAARRPAGRRAWRPRSTATRSWPRAGRRAPFRPHRSWSRSRASDRCRLRATSATSADRRRKAACRCSRP